jgi:hypothetical protein
MLLLHLTLLVSKVSFGTYREKLRFFCILVTQGQFSKNILNFEPQPANPNQPEISKK